MTHFGTCYFPSFADALAYYRPYLGEPPINDPTDDRANDRKESRLVKLVETKLGEGSIKIGKPPTKPGQSLYITDHRYHIQEV